MNDSKYYEVGQACPHCGARHGAISDPGNPPGDRAPQPWDCLICWSCGEIFTINDEGKFIVFSPDLLLKLRESPVFPRVKEAIAKVKRAKFEKVRITTTMTEDYAYLSLRVGFMARYLNEAVQEFYRQKEKGRNLTEEDYREIRAKVVAMFNEEKVKEMEAFLLRQWETNIKQVALQMQSLAEQEEAKNPSANKEEKVN